MDIYKTEKTCYVLLNCERPISNLNTSNLKRLWYVLNNSQMVIFKRSINLAKNLLAKPAAKIILEKSKMSLTNILSGYRLKISSLINIVAQMLVKKKIRYEVL